MKIRKDVYIELINFHDDETVLVSRFMTISDEPINTSIWFDELCVPWCNSLKYSIRFLWDLESYVNKKLNHTNRVYLAEVYAMLGIRSNLYNTYYWSKEKTDYIEFIINKIGCNNSIEIGFNNLENHFTQEEL